MEPTWRPDDREPTPEERRAAEAELQRELAEAPAEIVIANHAFGLFELAALHLSADPPQPGRRPGWPSTPSPPSSTGSVRRLGEAHQTFAEALAKLRMAFVQIQAAAQNRRRIRGRLASGAGRHRPAGPGLSPRAAGPGVSPRPGGRPPPSCRRGRRSLRS